MKHQLENKKGLVAEEEETRTTEQRVKTCKNGPRKLTRREATTMLPTRNQDVPLGQALGLT